MAEVRTTDVVLAVASFGGDRQVLDLVAVAVSATFAVRFSRIVVVDSGDPDRCQPLRDTLARDHPEVVYRWHAGNLGSAGNLVARLRWAAEVGADVVLAVNADGLLDADNVREMIACSDRSGAGAVYPTHVIDGRLVDLSGRQPVPILPSRSPLARLDGRRAIEVRWGSSNGALYRVDALQHVDLSALVGLWYGWEDLGLGLALNATGHRQLMSVTASQPTRADQRQLGPGPLVVSEKAPWTTYYGVRNLVLLARAHPGRTGRIALRVAREFVTILLRDRRARRYGLALRGLGDGLRGRTGMQIPPQA